MKILVVSIYRLGDETGTARISEELISQLSSKRNKVLYLCLGDNYEYITKGYLNFLKIPSIETKKGYVPILNKSIINNIYKDISNFGPDIIHAQNIVFNGLLALLWSIKYKVPYILTFHSIPSEGIRYVFPEIKENKLASTIEYVLSNSYLRRFIENVDSIICLNKSIVQDLNKLNVSNRLVEINNGISLDVFRKLRLPKYNKSKVINFVFLGSYTTRKNQLFLLKVFQHLPQNYKLNLYGNINTGKEYYDLLSHYIKTNNIKNVYLNDFLLFNKVPDCLAGMHYMVSASLKEVQSRSVIEALASGKPVISLSNETTDELVKPFFGINLSKNTKPSVFASKLFDFCDIDNKRYIEICTYARNSVVDFDWSSVTERIIKEYSYVIKNYNENMTTKSKNISSLVPEIFISFFKIDLNVHNKNKSFFLRIYLYVTFLLLGFLYILSKFKRFNDNK